MTLRLLARSYCILLLVVGAREINALDICSSHLNFNQGVQVNSRF